MEQARSEQQARGWRVRTPTRDLGRGQRKGANQRGEARHHLSKTREKRRVSRVSQRLFHACSLPPTGPDRSPNPIWSLRTKNLHSRNPICNASLETQPSPMYRQSPRRVSQTGFCTGDKQPRCSTLMTLLTQSRNTSRQLESNQKSMQSAQPQPL